MIGALLKALLMLVFVGLVMRAVRALSGGGSTQRRAGTRTRARVRRESGRAESPRARAGTEAEERAPGEPPVRREDIIDVPYEDS